MIKIKTISKLLILPFTFTLLFACKDPGKSESKPERSEPEPVYTSTCGNDQLDEGEECDGNFGLLEPGCTCTQDCKIDRSGMNTEPQPSQDAICGNGIVDGYEECDKGSHNGEPGCSCNSFCTLIRE